MPANLGEDPALIFLVRRGCSGEIATFSIQGKNTQKEGGSQALVIETAGHDQSVNEVVDWHRQQTGTPCPATTSKCLCSLLLASDTGGEAQFLAVSKIH